MYIFFLHLHHFLSWLLLASIIFTISRAWVAFATKKQWTQLDKTAGLVSTILIDVQLLTGLILYVFLSPYTKTAFYDFGAAMKNSLLRFYVVEHILVMLIAVALVHIGRSKAKKATTDLKKHKITAIFYSVALALILSRIPWDRLF